MKLRDMSFVSAGVSHEEDLRMELTLLQVFELVVELLFLARQIGHVHRQRAVGLLQLRRREDMS